MHYTTLHPTPLNSTQLGYITPTTTTTTTTTTILLYTTQGYTRRHYPTLHYTRPITHLQYSCNYTTLITRHHDHNSITVQLQLQLHYTTLHPAVVGEVTTATMATILQPPFRPSVDSLCHPCITTTSLSYRFPILKLPPPPCAVLLVIMRDSGYFCRIQNGNRAHDIGSAKSLGTLGKCCEDMSSILLSSRPGPIVHGKVCTENTQYEFF